MRKNRISVVITTYNRKYEVIRALKSVFGQSRVPDEIIVVDNGSIDNTECLLMKQKYKGLCYIRTPEPLGVGRARNIGIEKASGEYIAFLDSDNVWDNKHLEKLELELSQKKVDVVFHRYWKHKKLDKYVLPDIKWNRRKVGRAEILCDDIVDASSAVYRRDFLIKAGMFDENLKTHCDWEILLKGTEDDKSEIIYIPDVLTENWTLYDGLMENKEVEWEDRMYLFQRFQSELVEKNLIIPFYFSYQRNLCNEGTEDEKLEKLLKSCENRGKWTMEIVAYYEGERIKKEFELDRQRNFYQFMVKWMDMRLRGDSIAERLLRMNIHKVAIYGAGRHGIMLNKELEEKEVEVSYFIDKKLYGTLIEDISVLSIDTEFPEVDAIIVSPFLEFNHIAQELQKKGVFQIIALDSLVS